MVGLFPTVKDSSPTITGQKISGGTCYGGGGGGALAIFNPINVCVLRNQAI